MSDFQNLPAWKEVLAHPGYRDLLYGPDSPLAKRRLQLEQRILDAKGDTDPYELGLARGELAAYSFMDPGYLTRFESPAAIRGGDLQRKPRPRYLPGER